MKQFITLTFFVFLGICAFGQPSNDDCAGLINLGIAPICPVPDTFTNVDATLSMVFSNTNDNIPSCFTGGVIDRDVWFSFSVPTDGSIVDFTVTLTGVDGPNGSIFNPQMAIYRGDCLLDELQELDCVTAALGETSVVVDLLGLTPGLTYFLRISDWSASATPNWGDFTLCVDEYDPVFNMGEEDFTESCEGTLYDSGGPDGDYSNNENETFTICPQDFHQCILINVVEFTTESGFDELFFFAGTDITAPLITNLDGSGGGIELQFFSTCVTILFDSDGSFVDEGFELNWVCSPDTCTIPPPSTCDDPTMISALSFILNDVTTCNAGNEINNSPCNNGGFLGSEDFIFAYQSPGDECIAVNITGSNDGTGVGIYNDCPNIATDCIGQAGGGFGQSDPSINAAFLEAPGTYYIVVDNADNCTPFNIEITSVTCPVVFPSAADCEDALSLNGCGDLPAIISVAPGQGDPSVIVDGVNSGCWGGFTPNFTWFTFQAQADGDFGFIMQASNPDEASDIDFQVWGPISNGVNPCEYTLTHQPTRSSYAAGADPTGLVNINPITGQAVTDTCETAAGDDYVSTIDVLEGEFYIVLINDWGGAITSGAVSIDFDITTPGVLDALGANFMVSADTALCPGQSAQLFATGGEVYQWFPPSGLSCINCQNPVATVAQSTTYSVAINSVCNVDTLEVEVGLLQVDAGPDLTVCLNEDIQIVAGSNFQGVDYAWTGPAGFLSCNDCNDPIVTASQAGTFTFSVTVTGPTCSFSDEMTLTVLAGSAPAYEISDNLQICEDETVQLGGTGTAGVVYTWTSNPPGFISSEPNPSLTPLATTTYYLSVSGPGCPLPSFDSVLVEVAALPIIQLAADTTICLGESILLGTTTPQPGVVYAWTPVDGLNNPAIANPLATPTETTQYSLSAKRIGCESQGTINVTVTQIGVDIGGLDTVGICRGVQVPLQASAFPNGVEINWTQGGGSLNTTVGPAVVATPQTATLYVATVETGGCIKMDSVYIGVDSLPWDMLIMPADTQICEGEQVLLMSTTYEPGDFGQITFQWSPPSGQLTPDSLYNLVVQPGDTTVYQRIATNGFCKDTVSATVNVVQVASMTIDPQPAIICAGGSVQLNITADPGVTDFEWTPANGLSCTDCSNPIASPTGTITYSVDAEFDGCPVGASATVSISPTPQVQFPNPPVVCPGESVVLNETASPGAIYTWTSSDNSLTSTEPQPTVTPSQTTTYFVNAAIGNCSISEEVTISVPADFTLEVTPVDLICPGDSVLLKATASQAGVIFTWFNEAGNEIDASKPIMPSTTTTYTVVAADAGGCYSHTEMLDVEVSAFFSLDKTTLHEAFPDSILYEGEEFELSVTTSPPVIPGATYEWFFNETELLSTTTDTISGTLIAPELIDVDVQDFKYLVRVTKDDGCALDSLINVQVRDNPVAVPNVFSPNGDNTNDTFQLVSKIPVTILDFRVYNRWGQIVFDNENDGQGWNGTQNDTPAPSDVYIYYIVYEITNGSGKKYVLKGDLTLLR